MENQIEKKQSSSSVAIYKPNLQDALKNGNTFNVKLEISNLRREISIKGDIATLYIPMCNRLPSLARESTKNAIYLVSALLQLFFEKINIARPMTPKQIADLAEDIVLEQMQEDSDMLALEDLAIFLDNLIKGEYGQLYESMDSIKFFSLFEKYRERRFQAKKRLDEERASQLRAISYNSNTDRISESKSFREAMRTANMAYSYEKEINKSKQNFVC